MPRSRFAGKGCCVLVLVVVSAIVPDVQAQVAEARAPIVLRVEQVQDGPLILHVKRPAMDVEEEHDKPDVSPNQPIVLLSRDKLERLIFGSTANDNARRASLESLLEARIAGLGWDPPLSVSQKRTLRLAGKGDIKYLFDRAEEVRAAIDSHDRVGIALDDYRRLGECLRSLREAYRFGPFGDGSYFDKALRTIERREQAGQPPPAPSDRGEERAWTSRPMR
jgi:hypothetical protein